MSPHELNEMRAALMEVRENFEPLVEQSEGFRAQLEKRGWSPTSAEAAAAEMLIGMMRHLFATMTSHVNK